MTEKTKFEFEKSPLEWFMIGLELVAQIEDRYFLWDLAQPRNMNKPNRQTSVSPIEQKIFFALI